MGTDTKGKQEVEARSSPRPSVFTDEVAQSITIGEAQHAIAAGLIGDAAHHPASAPSSTAPTPAAARAEEITLFDGTGVGLQDLAVAATVVELARRAGKAIEVDI